MLVCCCRSRSANNGERVAWGTMSFEVQPQGSARPRRRVFASVDHLAPEAVAAFVDGELGDTAMHRARVHLVHCSECRAEVQRQRLAAEALQGSNWTPDVRAPRDLLRKLHDIAQCCEAGPGAEAVPTSQPETMLDKLECLMRAVRRNSGR